MNTRKLQLFWQLVSKKSFHIKNVSNSFLKFLQFLSVSYLKYNSCHPSHTKNIWLSLARRIIRIITDKRDFRLYELKQNLLKTNQPQKVYYTRIGLSTPYSVKSDFSSSTSMKRVVKKILFLTVIGTFWKELFLRLQTGFLDGQKAQLDTE